jgi:hypothetical protein
MWKMPESVVSARADNELPTISKEKAQELVKSNSENKSDKKSVNSKASS